ncbi:MAG: TIGR02266 family protein [Myxococcota bacterium]|jgi:uncharacterized protein (TIGR02266 family)
MTDTELERVESELAVEEAALFSELASLQAAAEALEARARAARPLAAEVAAAGGDAEVVSRLQQLVVPRAFGETSFERARRAREEAVRVRREAVAQVREQFASSRRSLSELSSQIQADEGRALALLEELRKQKQVRAEAVGGGNHQPPREAVVGGERPAGAEAPAGATALGAMSSLEEAIASTVAAARPAQRRAQRRVMVQTQVDFQSDANFYLGFSANISEGGIFVATVAVVPIGTEVDLNFTLPTGERIACQGVVRWVREVNDRLPDAFPGIGVQFVGLDSGSLEAIRRFVAQRDPLFYVD